MTLPYQFLDAGQGSINIVKMDGLADTRFVLYSERDNGYGIYTSDYGVASTEYRLSRVARPQTFEYLNATDGRYYQLPVSVIRQAIIDGVQPTEPTGSVVVRHRCWFGESETEIRNELTEERKGRLEQVITAARERKAYAEERTRLNLEAAELREVIEAAFAAEAVESFEEELARLLAEEGLTEWAEPIDSESIEVVIID